MQIRELFSSYVLCTKLPTHVLDNMTRERQSIYTPELHGYITPPAESSRHDRATMNSRPRKLVPNGSVVPLVSTPVPSSTSLIAVIVPESPFASPSVLSEQFSRESADMAKTRLDNQSMDLILAQFAVNGTVSRYSDTVCQTLRKCPRTVGSKYCSVANTGQRCVADGAAVRDEDVKPT